MKLFIGLVLTLMLTSVALAEGVTQQLGPYNVSFDMKSNMKYQVQPGNPIESPTATLYPLAVVTDNNTFSIIEIYESKEATDSTADMWKVITGLSLSRIGFNVTKSEDKVIDGKKGFVVTAEPFPQNTAAPAQLTQASYWMDSKECGECGPVSVGTVRIAIGSSYPNDVTDGILNSLKIMKSQ
ncbi:MAG: hypothetical protein MUO26_09160 [Methanotrichaceae archaeon]|nr:hypothetical protein [Methanotrichaceae archaeon]